MGRRGLTEETQKRLIVIEQMRKEGKTLQEIANHFGLSRQRIEQLTRNEHKGKYKRAFTKDMVKYEPLRRWLNENCENTKDFMFKMGECYESGHIIKIRNQLNGRSYPSWNIILKLINLTGMSFEEIFLSEAHTKAKEQAE